MKQVEEALDQSGYLFDFSKFLYDEHGLIVTDTEMQEIIHQAKKVDPVPVERTAEDVEALAVGSWNNYEYADGELYSSYYKDGFKASYNAAASTVPKTVGVLEQGYSFDEPLQFKI
jgi:hypothetical protein